jgi:hypothetical protein
LTNCNFESSSKETSAYLNLIEALFECGGGGALVALELNAELFSALKVMSTAKQASVHLS